MGLGLSEIWRLSEIWTQDQAGDWKRVDGWTVEQLGGSWRVFEPMPSGVAVGGDYESAFGAKAACDLLTPPPKTGLPSLKLSPRDIASMEKRGESNLHEEFGYDEVSALIADRLELQRFAAEQTDRLIAAQRRLAEVKIE
ncbi:MAG: hypothetical protein HRU00_17260 [Myxococcales bacterium]|nr:hypothetical protein [Myxococcales bacterium]